MHFRPLAHKDSPRCAESRKRIPQRDLKLSMPVVAALNFVFDFGDQVKPKAGGSTKTTAAAQRANTGR